MICEPCKLGGTLNADANRSYSPESARKLREAAIEAHQDCPGCDCHHQVVNWAIRRRY